MRIWEVSYQNQTVGYASFDSETGKSAFEYDPVFIKTGLNLSPIKLPLSKQIYDFNHLNYSTFKGLPGLLADSLPDNFGNAVLHAWVAATGGDPTKITPLERLQYTGKRGMGALEFYPTTQKKNLNTSKQIQLDQLVTIAQDVLNKRADFSVGISGTPSDKKQAMLQLLSVGTSAGGARPKAVLAFNDDFSKARSGQVSAPDGFSHYLIKFDGVSEHNKNQETFGDPLGYGAMEYVYYLMAKNCGINMMPCHLLDEGNRRHFITKRFDRDGNDKVHTQTLNGLAHVDFNQPGFYSYEELLGVARQLKLPKQDAEQIFKRMVFNVIARNHDDHSKNTSFIYQNTIWRLAPAYDLAYAYKPNSQWVSQHWMTLNQKRDHFNKHDFYAFESLSPIFNKQYINTILEQTISHVSQWPALAKANGVPVTLIKTISENLRLNLQN